MLSMITECPRSRCIIHQLSPTIDGAMADMLAIIDRGDALADCYFADNDLIAIGTIKALRLRGYKVPEQVAIVGFDNISEGRIIDPLPYQYQHPPSLYGTGCRQRASLSNKRTPAAYL